MWHASVSYHGRLVLPDTGQRFADPRREHALAMLRNVGDRDAGEWVEANENAYHLRRRLTATETGSLTVRDIRRTPEAATRLKILPRQVREMIPDFIIADEVTSGPARE